MNKTHDIHPALIVSFVLVLGLTVGTAVAMEKFGFAMGLDTTELEMEDLIPGRSDLLQPRNWSQIGGCDCRYRSPDWISKSHARRGIFLNISFNQAMRQGKDGCLSSVSYPKLVNGRTDMAFHGFSRNEEWISNFSVPHPLDDAANDV